jgi:hypothetical protein
MSTDKGKGSADTSVADRIAERDVETPFAFYEVRWNDDDEGELIGFTTSKLEYDICRAIRLNTLNPEYFADEDDLQHVKIETAQSYRYDIWKASGLGAGEMTYKEEALLWTLPDGTHDEDYDYDQRAVRTWGCKFDQLRFQYRA